MSNDELKGAADTGLTEEAVDTGLTEEAVDTGLTEEAGDTGLTEEAADTGLTEEADGCSGWMVWIGILLLINFLSWAFDWSFWLY
jgi:hypothetical protein